MQMETKRPFHETIVDAVHRCSSPSNGEILRLFQLIKDTKIPKGHDEIIAAIDEYFDFPGAEKWAREIREVVESLRDQKQASAKKTGDEKKIINLDDLQQETEKLLALLKDRRSGLMTWNEALLQNLHNFISQALGK